MSISVKLFKTHMDAYKVHIKYVTCLHYPILLYDSTFYHNPYLKDNPILPI